jgi:hypothetical protein
MSVRYLQSLRSHLNRFAERFGMNISSVTAAQIEDWLRLLKRGPRTRNNIRLSVVTLFNFAKARGYLPKSIATEAEHVAKAKDRGAKLKSSDLNSSRISSTPATKRPNFILRSELLPACAPRS